MQLDSIEQDDVFELAQLTRRLMDGKEVEFPCSKDFIMPGISLRVATAIFGFGGDKEAKELAEEIRIWVIEQDDNRQSF